ncbi:DUF3048 domain-containing protein [Pseudalkalibacillus sp. SCS-8]|uniref:DUF3048 domain-containing protein n=1 Tax=Pseudalkalibacillus nanhaiensis TaxID=3115291 RepID=UPI0032DA2CB5
MHKKGWLVTLLVALFLILAACQAKETATDEKKPEETEQKDERPVEEEPEEPEKPEEPEPAYTFPLTGIGTDEALHPRVIGVMINNAPEARPQSGLHKADLVYEVLAEGRITRMLALFQSEQPDQIGPVRSARDYYVRLNNAFDAIYVFHGWSPSAKSMLTSGNIDSLNGLYYDGSLFKRVGFRKAPHNSYITYDNIIKGAKKNNFELKQEIKPFSFMPEEDITNIEGDPATKMTVTYGKYQVTYRYDSEKGIYHRYTGNQQSVDRETGTPIELENVFVVVADHRIIDSAGRRNINLTSGGEALLFQEGKVQKIAWMNDNGRIIPVEAVMNPTKDAKPAEVPLVPGKTWVNVVPSSEYSSNVNWE